jgi:hypothetical protein
MGVREWMTEMNLIHEVLLRSCRNSSYGAHDEKIPLFWSSYPVCRRNANGDAGFPKWVSQHATPDVTGKIKTYVFSITIGIP